MEFYAESANEHGKHKKNRLHTPQRFISHQASPLSYPCVFERTVHLVCFSTLCTAPPPLPFPFPPPSRTHDLSTRNHTHTHKHIHMSLVHICMLTMSLSSPQSVVLVERAATASQHRPKNPPHPSGQNPLSFTVFSPSPTHPPKTSQSYNLPHSYLLSDIQKKQEILFLI